MSQEINLPGAILYGNQIVNLVPFTLEEAQEYHTISKNKDLNKLIRLYKKRLNIDVFSLTQEDFDYLVKYETFSLPDIKYSAKITCPHCGEEQNIIINVNDFKVEDLALDNSQGIVEFDSEKGRVFLCKILRLEDYYYMNLVKESNKLNEYQKNFLPLLFSVKYKEGEWLIDLLKNKVELGKTSYSNIELLDIIDLIKSYYDGIIPELTVNDAGLISAIKESYFKFGIDNIVTKQCPSCGKEVKIDMQSKLTEILPFRDKSRGLSRVRIPTDVSSRSSISRETELHKSEEVLGTSREEQQSSIQQDVKINNRFTLKNDGINS